VKCTNKAQKRIKHTVLLSLFLIICILGGILSILILRGSRKLDTVLPYDIETEVFGMAPEKSSQVADGIAASLCVAAEDKELEGVSVQDNERAALFDLNSKEVMFAKSMHEQAYPASITKVMTAIVAIKYGEMSDIVTISENAVAQEADSQVCGFAAGDKVSMEELLHGLLVYSGNDAAAAIAEHVGGSTEEFVRMMNEEAERLGATGTHFTNPHGLHDADHYTTVYDIYLMLNEAINYKEFVSMTQLGDYTLLYEKADGQDSSIYMESTDKYLTGEIAVPKDVIVLGGKTGTTDEAGACLALIAQNAYGEPFISIVLNAETKINLYERMSSLLQNINS